MLYYLPKMLYLLGLLFILDQGLTGAALNGSAGELDPVFGSGGLVTADFGTNSDFGHTVAVLPSGDIILAGSLWNGANGDMGLARYRPDGTLEPTFGSGGKVVTDLNGRHDQLLAIAVQPDGKIVAAGASYLQAAGEQDFAVLRYNNDGTLDSTFANGGVALTDMGANYDTAFAVAVQPDGKIVAAGVADHNGQGDIAVARYNPDGSLDTTFDGDGTVKTDLGSSIDWALGLALQPDGRIVVAGRSLSPANLDFALLRYNHDGSLDPTFDGDGIVISDANNMHNSGHDVIIQRDGRIVVTGYSFLTATNDGIITVARYNSDGSPDATFADNGVALTVVGGADIGNGIAQQADGKLVVVGDSWNGTNVDMALVRYLPDGSLDPAFGSGGIVTTDIGSNNNGATAVAFQSDGKILVAGYLVVGSDGDMVLARYLSGQPVLSRQVYMPMTSGG